MFSTMENNIRLFNYRVTVPEGTQRKAIVFFIHDYNSGTMFRHDFATMLAKEGYEFCGID